jgi:hypothetical protein
VGLEMGWVVVGERLVLLLIVGVMGRGSDGLMLHPCVGLVWLEGSNILLGLRVFVLLLLVLVRVLIVLVRLVVERLLLCKRRRGSRPDEGRR